MLHFEPSATYPDNLGTERVLVVNVNSSGQYGHVDIRVIRRALPKSETNYNDGENAQGYRNTSWAGNKKSSYYTADLAFTSQFNLFPRQETFSAEAGEQYVTRIKFTGDIEDHTTAEKISRTLKAWAKFRKEKYHNFGCDDWATLVNDLAEFLKIKTFIVNNGVYNCYDNAASYSEFPIHKINEVVEERIKQHIF